jgi:hypothetical protein
MIQRREDLGFAPEAREPFDVVRELLGQNLQGNVAIELGVLRPIHFTHAAAAKQREDVVRAEAGTAGERHAIS